MIKQKTTTVLEIPFLKNGDNMAPPKIDKSLTYLKPTYKFTTTLRYLGYFRNKANLITLICFQDTKDNIKYYMTIKNLCDAIKLEGFNGRNLKGTFSFTKSGTVYSIIMLKSKTQVLKPRENKWMDAKNKLLGSDYVNYLKP